MRVLQLGPYSPPHGGIQANVVALRRYLLEHSIACDVIDLNRLRRTDGAGVFGPRNALHLLWLLLRLPADIVHLHIGGNLTWRLLGLSLICGWLPARKSVLTFHSGGYPSSPEGRSAKPDTLRGSIMRQFDRVIGVNQEIVDVFERYGLPRSHVLLIQPHSLPAAPPSLELPEPLISFCAVHSPVLLSVGLLEPEYDLPLQIDLLGPLRQTFPTAGLILIGSGSLESALHKRINEKPYRQDVLLCGDMDRAVTLRMIADCQLFLRTTLFDGDSISVREALHFGVPVVASDSATRPDGTYLFPAGDLVSLRTAVERRLQEGVPRAPQGIARQENLAAVAELYRELVEGGGMVNANESPRITNNVPGKRGPQHLRLGVWILLVVGICFGLAWVAAQALIVKLPLERADAVVVLSGSAAYLERTQLAAQLYASGRAPRVILTNDNQVSGWSGQQQRNPFFIELARDELIASGVRSEKIEIVPVAVTGTYDECLKIRRYAEMQGYKSLLVVTSAYHSRRVLWTLRQVFRGSGIEIGLDIVNPGQQMPFPTTWWLSRRGWRVVALEYPKLVYYWLAYH